MLIRAITKSRIKQEHIYKVYTWDNRCLTIIWNKANSQGQSQWCNLIGYNDIDYESGSVAGAKMINYYEVPTMVQSHIEQVLMEMVDS